MIITLVFKITITNDKKDRRIEKYLSWQYIVYKEIKYLIILDKYMKIIPFKHAMKYRKLTTRKQPKSCNSNRQMMFLSSYAE